MRLIAQVFDILGCIVWVVLLVHTLIGLQRLFHGDTVPDVQHCLLAIAEIIVYATLLCVWALMPRKEGKDG